MSHQTDIEVAMGWRLEDRDVELIGVVTLGGRWPRVSGFRALDPRTADDLDLPEWAKDEAEEAMISEAQYLWGRP